MKNKIGVYICQCGANISDYVDVEKVRNALEGIPEVALAKTTMFACADSAQQEIIEDIRDQNLDAIVVASCSPKLHLFTFRNVQYLRFTTTIFRKLQHLHLKQINN